MDATAREYSRSHIGQYLTKVAVLVSWEKHQAHRYAFKDIHRGTNVPMELFTDRRAAEHYLDEPISAVAQAE